MKLQIRNASTIATFNGSGNTDQDGYWIENDVMREGGSILVEDGIITDVGDIPAADDATVIDATGMTVTPGFVDPHTHPVFAATREMEFVMRIKGATYLEITEAGGGILTSVETLRRTDPDILGEMVSSRLDRMLLHGTTTVEAKSGYGLSTESELMSLEVLGKISESHPLDILRTFLGAHQIPAEYADDRKGYVNKLTKEMLPIVVDRGLAEFCDCFCDEAAFSVEETRIILDAAKELGLGVRIHADELSGTGGAELASELGALSADHLVSVSDPGMKMMKESGVVPIVLPGTTFFLGMNRHAPARRMISMGLPVALATDFNPGSSMTESMQMILSLACINLGMTPYEAFRASTANSALSLGLKDRGKIAPGMKGDLLILDTKSIETVPYNFGVNHVVNVIKNGLPVVMNGKRTEVS